LNPQHRHGSAAAGLYQFFTQSPALTHIAQFDIQAQAGNDFDDAPAERAAFQGVEGQLVLCGVSLGA
jgi:hypothetical protein